MPHTDDKIHHTLQQCAIATYYGTEESTLSFTGAYLTLPTWWACTKPTEGANYVTCWHN